MRTLIVQSMPSRHCPPTHVSIQFLTYFVNQIKHQRMAFEEYKKQIDKISNQNVEKLTSQHVIVLIGWPIHCFKKENIK